MDSTFAVPVLRDAQNNFESVLLVRHFCGDYGASNRKNTPQTLVQGFISQVIRQHASHFSQRPGMYGKERFAQALGSLDNLWALFLECLVEVKTHCVFVVIDSIDSLQDEDSISASHGSDIELLIAKLNDLAKTEKIVAKILLTTSFTEPAKESSKPISTAVGLLVPQRRLSLDSMQQENQAIRLKLSEIDEGRCQRVTWPQILLLYRVGTTIFSAKDKETRAFVVCELGGGTKSSTPGRFEPWSIHCWSIDHDGQVFVQRYHDISIPQYSGQREVTKLEFIPSGYVKDEVQIRQRLLERGREFWNYTSGCHHREYAGDKFTARRKKVCSPSPQTSRLCWYV